MATRTTSSTPRPSLLPGQAWLSKLESLYFLHPSVFGRRLNDKKYWLANIVIVLIQSFNMVILLTGAFFPDIGIAMGNFLIYLGVAGQVMSLGAGSFHIFIFYCRFRILAERDVPFIRQLVAYDDPRNRTILSDHYASKVRDIMRTGWLAIRVAAAVTIFNISVNVFADFFVVPLLFFDINITNVLKAMVITLFGILSAASFAQDWMYIFGSWFLCKSHLDVQVDCWIDMTERLVTTKERLVNTVDIRYLEFRYNRLTQRVREFDRLSRDLISPYRTVVSYFCVLVIFGAYQQDNLMVKYSFSAIMGTFYVGSLVFLSLSCTLSIRRTRMYQLVNELYVKVSRQSLITLGQLFTLRRMVKSLGNYNRPTVCLSDKSGEEMDPMEFVEFVLDTFSQFTLASSLYYSYVH